MIRSCFRLLPLAVVTGCAGAAKDPATLPGAGTYGSSEPGSTECLQIGEREIFFHVRGREGQFVDRAYGYSVWNDGTLMPHPVASADYFMGVGVYDWRLTEEGVVRVETKTGDRVMFTRDEGLHVCHGSGRSVRPPIGAVPAK